MLLSFSSSLSPLFKLSVEQNIPLKTSPTNSPNSSHLNNTYGLLTAIVEGKAVFTQEMDAKRNRPSATEQGLINSEDIQFLSLFKFHNPYNIIDFPVIQYKHHAQKHSFDLYRKNWLNSKWRYYQSG